MERVDGHRTIADIVEGVVESGAFARSDVADVAAAAVDICTSLWQEDFLAMGLTGR